MALTAPPPQPLKPYDINIPSNTIENKKIKDDDRFMFQSITSFHLVLGSSLPLCIGAYAGYRLEMNRLTTKSNNYYVPGSITSNKVNLTHNSKRSKQAMPLSSLSSSVKYSDKIGKTIVNCTSHVAGAGAAVSSSSPVSVNIGLLGFKALGIGTMLSVGGVGLMVAGVFKATGCASLEELIRKCREWTPRTQLRMQKRLGLKPKSLENEDVKATKGMPEDEEWMFIKRKYIPELLTEDEKRITVQNIQTMTKE